MKKPKLIPLYFRNKKNSPIETFDHFYPNANLLRSAFQETFSDPYSANSNRFCWDFWTIRNQYQLLRTPAESFFGEKVFTPFLNHLLSWGRSNLGCQMISHPWLSAYTDGCYQNFHSDVPHGPFSFVYSLTHWKKRTFKGGETFVANPRLLRYFSEITPETSHEEKDLLTHVAPEFNRMTVFDPRYPHGVTPVQGVDSILGSRLVIHGWFTDPRPMLEGALSFKKIMKPMDDYAHSIIAQLSPLNYAGLLSLRLSILPSGAVEKIEILSSHLLNAFGQPIPQPLLKPVISNPGLFPKSSGKSWITLPIEIQNH